MIIIMQGERFKLESAGNNTVYLLTNVALGGSEVAVQGADVFQFRAALKARMATMPYDTPDDILAWLWNQWILKLYARRRGSKRSRSLSI